MIHHRAPDVTKSGSDVRLTQLLLAFLECGLHVTLILVQPCTEPQLLETIEHLGITVLHGDAQQLRSEGVEVLKSWTLQGVLAQSFDFAVLTLWFWNLFTIPEQYTRLIRTFSPHTKVILLTDDRHGERQAQLAAVTDTFFDTEMIQDRTDRERQAYASADLVICIGQREYESIRRDVPEALVAIVPFFAQGKTPTNAFISRSGILFLGNFCNPAVRDAATFLLRDILPRLNEQLPSLTVTLAGNSSETFDTMGVRNVVSLGHVRDLESIFGQHRVFISPMRIGTGVSTKNMTAMAHGLPVVTTSFGIMEISAEDGVNIMIANDAEGLSRAALEVYTSSATWARLSENGKAVVSLRPPGSITGSLRDALRMATDNTLQRSCNEFSISMIEQHVPGVNSYCYKHLRRIRRGCALLCLGQALFERGFFEAAAQQYRHALAATGYSDLSIYREIVAGLRRVYERLSSPANVARCEQELRAIESPEPDVPL